jgi:anti-sigma factor RsiW
MNCEKIKALLSAYVDGEVTEKEARLIREHIAVCADCKQEEQSLYRTSEMLKHWGNTPAPDGFCEALLAKAENVTRRPRRSIIDAVRPLAGPRAIIRVAVYGATFVLLCVAVILLARPPLRRASMVEPLPTISESTLQNLDETAQGSESFLAEIKVKGLWK